MDHNEVPTTGTMKGREALPGEKCTLCGGGFVGWGGEPLRITCYRNGGPAHLICAMRTTVEAWERKQQ